MRVQAALIYIPTVCSQILARSCHDSPLPIFLSQLSENSLGLSLRAGLAPDDPKNVRWRQTRNMQNYAEGLCEGSVNVETC